MHETTLAYTGNLMSKLGSGAEERLSLCIGFKCMLWSGFFLEIKILISYLGDIVMKIFF